jgi:hypothetical protein
MYILCTGFGKSLALYKTLPKEYKIQDREASLLILKYFLLLFHVFYLKGLSIWLKKCVSLCVQ